MASEIPEPWHSFLLELDGQMPGPVTLNCLGGFAISIAYGLPRPTADIDVCDVTPAAELQPIVERAGRGSALYRKHGVYLQIVTVATLPEDYARRTKRMFSGKHDRLRLYVLDPYDLALSKIERNSERDIDDVKLLQRGKRYPTILRIHGGPVYQFSHEFMDDWQVYAAHGYAVVARIRAAAQAAASISRRRSTPTGATRTCRTCSPPSITS